jgi:hypothetical protein
MQQVLDDWAAAFKKEDAGKVAMHHKSVATPLPRGNDKFQEMQNLAKPDEEIKIKEPAAYTAPVSSSNRKLRDIRRFITQVITAIRAEAAAGT